MQSLMNKVFIEPYAGERKIKAEVKSGFARVQQRTNLVGLKIMADATCTLGQVLTELKKGQTAFFLETDLHSANWSKTTYECEGIEGKFAIVDWSYIQCVH